LRRAADAVADLDAGAVALDAGGGPGRHAAVWAETGVRAVVLDPSFEMLSAAAARNGVFAVGGVSQNMPFRDAVFDLVAFHLSIHYGSWRDALSETLRVLRARGACKIWTLGPLHHASSMLARWFPTVADIDARRFPEPADLAEYLESRCRRVEHDIEIEQVVRSAGHWERAVRAGFVSTLQLVTEQEIEQGLRDFRRAHPDPDEQVAYALRFDRIVAVR
jgi:ubiquinone/menaquinone biosynthesis C-methylase UbiE